MYKTVKAKFCLWLLGESPSNLFRCSIFARKRYQNQVRQVKSRGFRNFLRKATFLPENVYELVLQESVPAQIRQRIRQYYFYKEQVDGFVREVTFAKRLCKHSV